MGRPRKNQLPIQLTSEVDSESLRLAKRIWEGQSPSLYRKVRVERILAALREHGMPTDGVEEGLPQ